MGPGILGAASDEAFAFSDLKEDFVYGRIPRERRGYYIDFGLRMGREAARCCQGAGLEEILGRDGVSVVRVEAPSPSGLHAQICYDGKTRRVDLFCDTARTLSRALEGSGAEQTPRQLEQLFLAHEFYHWLEYSSGQLASEQCERVEWPVLRLFRRRAWVRRVDEIAAFAFAKEVCGLPVHPKALDYLFLYRQQGKQSGQIAPLLAALEEEYRRECL